MKKKETKVKEPVYTVDRKALTEQLLKDETSNWVIEKGANMIINGETPGKNMIAFLELMNVIKIS